MYYVLNNAPEKWAGGVGFVSRAMIKEHLPAVAPDTKILLCGASSQPNVRDASELINVLSLIAGPPPMMTAMKKCLDELKFEAPRTISKLPDQVFLF